MGHTFEQVTQLYAHLQPEHLHKQVARIPKIKIGRVIAQQREKYAKRS
jgi:hypothetical protein